MESLREAASGPRGERAGFPHCCQPGEKGAGRGSVAPCSGSEGLRRSRSRLGRVFTLAHMHACACVYVHECARMCTCACMHVCMRESLL